MTARDVVSAVALGLAGCATQSTDSFLGLINPLMTFFILGARSTTARGNYQARLIEKMEDDSVEMRRRGYRVVSSREYERSALGITYFKVTYELVEPPK